MSWGYGYGYNYNSIDWGFFSPSLNAEAVSIEIHCLKD